MGAASAQRSVLELLLLSSGFCCGGGKGLSLSWPLGIKSGCCGERGSQSEDSVRLALLSKMACSACETDGMEPCVQETWESLSSGNRGCLRMECRSFFEKVISLLDVGVVALVLRGLQRPRGDGVAVAVGEAPGGDPGPGGAVHT